MRNKLLLLFFWIAIVHSAISQSWNRLAGAGISGGGQIVTTLYALQLPRLFYHFLSGIPESSVNQRFKQRCYIVNVQVNANHSFLRKITLPIDSYIH